MGESDVPTSASQPSSQRLPQRRECSHGLERGIRCALPPDPVTGVCQRHDPSKAEARKLQARTAAQVSHAMRALRLFGPEWSDPDFSTVESRRAFREAVAGARGRGELDDNAARTLLTACDGVAKEAERQGKPAAPPVIVEVARYGNGHSE